VRAIFIFNTSVWLQAGQHLALAAQIPAKQKSGCPRLRLHRIIQGQHALENKDLPYAKTREILSFSFSFSFYFPRPRYFIGFHGGGSR
jgi:hypothetical protein